MNQPLTIWGLTDGSAGMMSQVRGVGEGVTAKTNALFTLKSARRRRPFCWLPGNIYCGALKQLTHDSDALNPPYPDMVISSGRRSVALALAIRRASKGKTKLVHLQGPRIPLHYFDLVVPMEHDGLSGANVINTFAALHHITEEKLLTAREAYTATNPQALTPHAAIFLGGSTHAYALTQARMKQVVSAIETFAAQVPQAVWLSTSRRTGAENIALLKQHASPKIEIYSGEGENPYLAWLALAEILVVSNDSVSMMSEAHYTGKPLYILKLPEHTNTKPAKFANQLIERGLAAELSFPLPNYAAKKIDERSMVVEHVSRLFGFKEA